MILVWFKVEGVLGHILVVNYLQLFYVLGLIKNRIKTHPVTAISLISFLLSLIQKFPPQHTFPLNSIYHRFL